MYTEPSRWDRRERYGAGANWLQENVEHMLAPAVFNLALTNGILEIAGYVGLKADRSNSLRTPSARELLRRFLSEGSNPEELTEATIKQLLDGLDATDPARHGRQMGRLLNEDDLNALSCLDRHPALQILEMTMNTEYDVEGEAADLMETDRAEDYLKMIGEAEEMHRAERVPVPPLRKAPDDPHPVEPSTCPVCSHESLVSTGDDEMGYGITVGSCFVCSYRRSSYAANMENIEREWERREGWDH